MNVVTLIGNVVGSPVSVYPDQSVHFVLDVARPDPAEPHDTVIVACSGRQAELVSKLCQDGLRVGVDGRIRQSGNGLRVEANAVQFLTPKLPSRR